MLGHVLIESQRGSVGTRSFGSFSKIPKSRLLRALCVPELAALSAIDRPVSQAALAFGAMDGAHDLGGMHGFGPVVSEGPTEPSFTSRGRGGSTGWWSTLIAGRNRGLGSFRHSIEQMGNERYLTTPYYEHWLDGLERLLTEGSVIEAGVVDGRVPPARLGTPGVRTRAGRQGRRHCSPRRWEPGRGRRTGSFRASGCWSAG